MRSAIVSGIVTGHAAVSYWPILSLSPMRVPEVFGKVNSTQFLSRFKSGESQLMLLLQR